ncbi:hypothetical protein DOTSEDRAFT_73433 [Dothistroma septosporum NZE10]|uniref:Uncharacterized protein n=1 Tax=Dothistroma septosporum (strain NZE10 / CBS 128990) TaxID=675120 RepID=N1PKF7_DOTSN|nr:hypothetical protein DOTSEDRAFT_73433 [Dothistroma septosporum NZE10]
MSIMFMTGGFSGVGFNGTDPQHERDPPPAPTPIVFPKYEPGPPTAWSHESQPALQKHFTGLRGPSDISPRHIDALNVRYTHTFRADDLVPLAPDGSSYLPPLSAEQAIVSSAYANANKIDSVSAKRGKNFDERLIELQIENDAGYRNINRTTKPGSKPPRIAWLRKFWEGLESMSQYWDTSLDEYYEGFPDHLVNQENVEKGHKRQRTDSSHPSSGVTVPIFHSETRLPPAEANAAVVQKRLADQLQQDAAKTPPPRADETSEGASAHDTARRSRSKSATPEPRACMRYKGYRTASGRDMPDQFRTDTVRAFVEAACWAFDCKTEGPRRLPIVRLSNLQIPVRQTAAVYRVPKDRNKIRSGWLEGPMLTIQVRPETDFYAPNVDQAHSAMRERLDLMREIAGLLQCAQERRREGKTEVRSGEGKWWTTTARWGGGPGGEVDHDEGDPDALSKDVLGIAEEILGAPKARAPKKLRKGKTPAMLWKELKPGSRTWDARTGYQAIGKERDSPYDQVFMVSSLNRHISILKFTVHEAYLEYLETERPPSSPLPADKSWCSPRLERTQWYDLFDIQERVQAFRALWGVMAYLSRDNDKQTEAGAEGTDGAVEAAP